MASSWGNDGALSRRSSETPRKRHPNVSGLPRTAGTVTKAVKRAAAGRRSVTRPSICQRGRRESVTQTEIPRRRGCITSPKRGSRRQSARNVSPKRKRPPAAGPQPSPKRGSRLHGGKKRHQYADIVHGEDEKRHRNGGPTPRTSLEWRWAHSRRAHRHAYGTRLPMQGRRFAMAYTFIALITAPASAIGASHEAGEP